MLEDSVHARPLSIPFYFAPVPLVLEPLPGGLYLALPHALQLLLGVLGWLWLKDHPVSGEFCYLWS